MMGRKRRPGGRGASPEDERTRPASGERPRPPTADRGQPRDESTLGKRDDLGPARRRAAPRSGPDRPGTTSHDAEEGTVSVEHTRDPSLARVRLKIVLPWDAALAILKLVRGAPDRRD
jgi:hypothetical protein